MPQTFVDPQTCLANISDSATGARVNAIV